MSDHEGGTFTVTNLGAYGIDGFTPIINYPQVAILGVGAVREVPVFAEDGSVVRGAQMVLSLTLRISKPSLMDRLSDLSRRFDSRTDGI